MLSAISADLPAYLVPPTQGGEGRQTETQESRFGPAARVNLSSNGAAVTESRGPGVGLYGPDGQFVEGGARRELQDRAAGDRSTGAGAPAVAGRSEAGPGEPTSVLGGAAALEAPRGVEAAAETDAGQRRRDLDLTDFDSIIPPAAREELATLADRVGRDVNTRALEPRDYKKIAELMARVGRFDKAHQALTRAEKIESAGQAEQAKQAPAVLAERAVPAERAVLAAAGAPE